MPNPLAKVDPDAFAASVRRALARRLARAAQPFKVCPLCKRHLAARDFGDNAAQSDGLQVY